MTKLKIRISIPIHGNKFAKSTFSFSYVHNKIDELKFSFKTPTLRNISKTSPYMHNGEYKTLNEVMDFYNKGGGAGLGIKLRNQTLSTDKLNLSKPEQKAIISFLNTLTDTN